MLDTKSGVWPVGSAAKQPLVNPALLVRWVVCLLDSVLVFLALAERKGSFKFSTFPAQTQAHRLTHTAITQPALGVVRHRAAIY